MADQTDRVLSFSFLCTAYHLYHIRAHEKSVPLFTAHFDMHSKLYPILFRIKLAFGNDYTLRGYTSPLPKASEASRREQYLSRVLGKKVGGKYKKRPVKKSVVYWL